MINTVSIEESIREPYYSGFEHKTDLSKLTSTILLTTFTTNCFFVTQFMQAITRIIQEFNPFGKRKRPHGAAVLNHANEERLEDDIFSKIIFPKQVTIFHGYECASFTYNHRDCKLVRPHKPAPDYPWIWRARFWDHQPQVDLLLLEKGFHVAYCDVVELFGNKESIDIWNRFYDYVQGLGLSSRVALHAMSRGSFYAYNWALANAGKVSCIYADNPILDIKSWPWNMGKGIGSKKDRRILRKAFNFTSDEDVIAFRENPLDKAKEIAELGFPLLHVCSEQDEYVPIEENTNLFEQLINNHGGNITVIRKPGVAHHPHGLPDPSPIISFVLNATFSNTGSRDEVVL